MIVSRDKTIFRFHSSKALYLLSPFNPIRRIAMYILTHPYPFWCQTAADVTETNNINNRHQDLQ